MTDYNDLTNFDVTIEEDGVAIVEIATGAKGNALGPAFWEQCPTVFDRLSEDDDVRVVLLRGAGDHFTYGLDLMANAPTFMGVMADAGEMKARQMLYGLVKRWQRGFDAIESCAKPVVAACAGWCIGGGVNLIAACDVRVASASARFSLREVKLAITPDLGALQRLPAIIGQGHTRRLALTGEDIDADRARAIGLVEDVYPDEEFGAQARALAGAIAANPPAVTQGIKNVLNYCADKSNKDGEQYVALWNSAFLPSKDLMEAMTAYAQGRAPEFTGE